MDTNDEKRAGRSPAAVAVHVICLLCAAALTEVFFVLSFQYFAGRWNMGLWLFAVIGVSALNAGLLAVDLVGYFLQKPLLPKLCVTTYILAVFVAVGFFILVKTGFWEIMQSEGSFASYLERVGSGYMTALFITLQFLQVVILPIPSTVTVVAGAMLFGELEGSLYSLAGIVLGSVVAFLIGRYAGVRFVSWLIGKDTLEKWLAKIKGKDKLLLTAMFLLPVFPDDVLCFVAGFSSMSFWYFLAVILISRVLAVFTTSYSITLIPFDTWWGILIWAVLIVLIAVLFVVLYKKSDAILNWFDKKFHRETRVREEKKADEFSVEIVSPDGTIVQKGVKKDGEDPPEKPQ